MDQSESLCLWASRRAYKAGDISEETRLRHDLAHIFAGVRHPEEGRLEASKVEDWAAIMDMWCAAVLNCMLQEIRPPPGSSMSFPRPLHLRLT